MISGYEGSASTQLLGGLFVFLCALCVASECLVHAASATRIIELGIDPGAPFDFSPALHIELQGEDCASGHIVDWAFFRETICEFGDARIVADHEHMSVFAPLRLDYGKHDFG